MAEELSALLLLPLLAFWVMRFVPINQEQFIDPYVYTGYIHNFRDLIARFDLTYYSVRFGLILPAKWFAQLFGPLGGYFTLRYVLALIASVPLYYMVKGHFSQPVAILTVVGMMTSPYFARALLWDHPDATGVPFLTASICLFLLADRPSLWQDALAGACAAMAVNSNFFEVALLGIFGMTWLFCFLWFRRPLRELLKKCAGAAMGGLLVSAFGCLYYWRALGRLTNIYAVTFRIMSALAKGGAKQWRTPGIDWIAMQIHVLIPVLLVVCCIVVARWRRVSFTSFVAIGFGLAVTGFYYVEQFFLESDVLQLAYYFSYLMPAVFLMLAFLWQMLWKRTQQGAAVFIGIGAAAWLAPWLLATWHIWQVPSMTVSQWFVLGGLAGAAMLFATRNLRLPHVHAVLPLVALILLTGCVTVGFADYSAPLHIGASKNTEMDVYRVALQFIRAVPKVADHSGSILFWYNNRVGNAVNSVQSTYLWGYSKLNKYPPGDPGLPSLDQGQLRTLRQPELRYLGLLCESEAELSQGLAALTRESVPFEMADYRVLASGDYRIYYQLVELTHSPVARP